MLEVHVGAKSVNCRHCHRRVISEALTVKDSALALGSIKLTKKARVKGDLRACTLSLEWGVTYSGHLRIGRHEVPEMARLEPGASPSVENEAMVPDGIRVLPPKKKAATKSKTATKKATTKKTSTTKKKATVKRKASKKKVARKKATGARTPSAKPPPARPTRDSRRDSRGSGAGCAR